MGEPRPEMDQKVYTRNSRTEGAHDGAERAEQTGQAGRAERADGAEKPGKRRLDLNAAQVAGSAVAAVVAAKLASKMGVYGTVLGAGVISIIATCGGSVFQHVFRSTGERVRGVTEAALPATRPTGRGTRASGKVRRFRGAGRAGKTGKAEEARPDAHGVFGEATTYGTRVRGWKRSAVAAALVFGVAMAGITAYELISGQDFSGGKGTTISGVVRGGDSGSRPDPDPGSQTGGQDGQRDKRHQQQGTPGATDPDTGRDGGGGGGTNDPSTDPGTGSTDPTPTPTPTPSGKGGGQKGGDQKGGDQDSSSGTQGSGGTGGQDPADPTPPASPADPTPPTGPAPSGAGGTTG
ncbi:hypothetical protein [Streptomyces sp. NPDC015131]|uniref:hypothetical protein n=1 Tax=Streptomyces sp. NPDC015131 TaxID=3364941 RepID=UPI0037028122